MAGPLSHGEKYWLVIAIAQAAWPRQSAISFRPSPRACSKKSDFVAGVFESWMSARLPLPRRFVGRSLAHWHSGCER